jgi:hypothetical protein
MLALLGLGQLARARAFVEEDVAPEWIEAIDVGSDAKAELLAGCVPALRGAGRTDLAAAVERRIERARGDLATAAGR